MINTLTNLTIDS